MTDCKELRRQIIDVCLWLEKNGLVFGTWGNVSVKFDGGNILITPSRISYGNMTEDDFVVLSPDGERISGERLPTSEREIHRAIHNARSDVGAIIHMHSPKGMAACAREKGVPVISEEMCQLIGGAIPLTKRFVPSDDHEGLGRAVAECLTDANAVLIRNHGPVCMGKDLEEAKLCCLVTEKSCGIYLDLLAAGGYNEISPENVKAGRDYYLNKYGKT